MSKRKKPQIVEIRWPFRADPPNLYCPRTGQLVLDYDNELEQPASPCVTFFYINEIAEFAFIRNDLRQRLDEAKASLIEAGTEDIDMPDDLEILKKHVDVGEVPMIFEITTSGMGCGPVQSTVIVGFDLWMSSDEGDSDE